MLQSSTQQRTHLFQMSKLMINDDSNHFFAHCNYLCRIHSLLCYKDVIGRVLRTGRAIQSWHVDIYSSARACSLVCREHELTDLCVIFRISTTQGNSDHLSLLLL